MIKGIAKLAYIKYPLSSPHANDEFYDSHHSSSATFLMHSLLKENDWQNFMMSDNRNKLGFIVVVIALHSQKDGSIHR